MSLLIPERRPSHEILDDEKLPPEEMARSLRDLELVQRAWGGARALAHWLVPRMARGDRPVLVDVGAGSGAVTRELGRRLAAAGLSARTIAVDLQWRHLAAGRTRAAGVLSAAADAFSLPFADGGVDWAVSTLVFHHFSPAENRAFLRELSRVSRRGFLVLDLRRHRVPWIVVSLAGRMLFETRVSLLDGRASVLQAYTPDEADRIASDAVPGAHAESVFPYRILIRGPGR
ncbi:MAG TPA: methyltransferase domain-containing protein [Thermoanaerobaculia bacterium]|nr:methyltransferase domain-containing protein [Thermoanaerobaculia bacterium]